MTALLEVRNLRKHYTAHPRFLRPNAITRAVEDVSLEVSRGETLGLVGESGSGKTTVGRCILRLTDPNGGEILLGGQRIDNLDAAALRPLRRRMQVIFQDPAASLNPRMTIGALLAEPIRNFGLADSEGQVAAQVAQWLEKVRLAPDVVRRRPHEFSGGQRQRIAIARALAAQPELIVCDEAVSALDVSIKAQIVDLLLELQREFGLALLFISHDLPIVGRIAHRVAVMHAGKIVEQGETTTVFTAPRHAYTRGLIDAVPSAHVETPPPDGTGFPKG